MLTIPKSILEEMAAHAASGLPEEVCGYLAGRDGRISRLFRMTNTDHSPDHFSFDPLEQFSVYRQARSEEMELLANYHSHPLSPARPSAEDIRLAYDPSIRYLIVSLAGSAPDIRSFLIRDGKVEEEPIQVEEG
ncbi:MAG: M67 family metallopeptidase [Marinilabiliales bacterium]|nr:M67 family metallopeptidase [Marinilabiliales bacterium]